MLEILELLDLPVGDFAQSKDWIQCSIIIIIKLYCHIQCALHDELECSLALTHIVPK